VFEPIEPPRPSRGPIAPLVDFSSPAMSPLIGLDWPSSRRPCITGFDPNRSLAAYAASGSAASDGWTALSGPSAAPMFDNCVFAPEPDADRRATGLISFKLSGSRWPPTPTRIW
jgi:hypothetical protein